VTRLAAGLRKRHLEGRGVLIFQTHLQNLSTVTTISLLYHDIAKLSQIVSSTNQSWQQTLVPGFLIHSSTKRRKVQSSGRSMKASSNCGNARLESNLIIAIDRTTLSIQSVLIGLLSAFSLLGHSTILWSLVTTHESALLAFSRLIPHPLAVTNYSKSLSISDPKSTVRKWIICPCLRTQ
jgi:hypothetical protein